MDWLNYSFKTEEFGYIEEPYILYRQHGKNQVGIVKASNKFNKISQVRDVSIDIKIGIFETYVQNENIFDKEIKKQNEKALEYFKMLKTKKYINFKKWGLFYKLYKTETFIKFIENFMVLNMPIIVAPIFKIRNKILKI